MNETKNNSTGCAIMFLIGLGLVVILAVALGYANDSATRQANAQANLELAQGRARAMIIEAQAESRLHSAQAWAITAGAIIPFLALAIVGLLGLSIVALASVIATRPRQLPPQLPTFTIMYLPPPQATRRELWQMITEHKPVLIEAGRITRENYDHSNR
jgi:hypothetical protein